MCAFLGRIEIVGPAPGGIEANRRESPPALGGSGLKCELSSFAEGGGKDAKGWRNAAGRPAGGGMPGAVFSSESISRSPSSGLRSREDGSRSPRTRGPVRRSGWCPSPRATSCDPARGWGWSFGKAFMVRSHTGRRRSGGSAARANGCHLGGVKSPRQGSLSCGFAQRRLSSAAASPVLNFAGRSFAGPQVLLDPTHPFFSCAFAGSAQSS